MGESLGPLNTLGMLLLGGALLWAVRLIYGARIRASDDFMRRLLSIAGWLLIVIGMLGALAGMLGPISIVFWILALIVLLMALGKYQDAERRSLLWVMAVAAERGIPLAAAVRSFADERSFTLRAPVSRLAMLLEQGVPLPQAMHASRNPLPMDAQLAVELGCATGQLGPALRQVVRHVDMVEMTLRTALERLLYLLVLIFVSSMLLVFFFLVIAPRLQAVMASFGVTLHWSTEVVFDVADAFASYWYLLLPFIVILPVLCVIILFYYVGWLNVDLPFVGWIWLRYDGGLVMRSLAITVRQQRSMLETIAMLSRQFPRRSTRRRLRRAIAHMNNGVPWTLSLRRAGLLRSYEAAVLQSAERVGNLAWALEEMADSCLRRIAYRFRNWLSWLMPPLLLTFGCALFLLAVGLFIPLAKLTMMLQ